MYIAPLVFAFLLQLMANICITINGTSHIEDSFTYLTISLNFKFRIVMGSWQTYRTSRSTPASITCYYNIVPRWQTSYCHTSSTTVIIPRFSSCCRVFIRIENDRKRDGTGLGFIKPWIPLICNSGRAIGRHYLILYRKSRISIPMIYIDSSCPFHNPVAYFHIIPHLIYMIDSRNSIMTMCWIIYYHFWRNQRVTARRSCFINIAIGSPCYRRCVEIRFIYPITPHFSL